MEVALSEAHNRPIGSATLMRGKSLTCRQLPSFFFGSATYLYVVIDRKFEKQISGKSQTCRASEWQSHGQCCLAPCFVRKAALPNGRASDTFCASIAGHQS
jgi:hypothetical protein